MSDQFGSVESDPALLLFKAQITVQPQSKTVRAGDPVSFSVTLTGSLPITYRWRHDGQTIGGWPQTLNEHTTTITIEAAEADDAGSYNVVISNGAPGQIPFISETAELTVNP